MKTIELTLGQVALVDDEDFEYLNSMKWRASWHNNTKSFYAARADRSTGKYKTVYMHRLIMQTPSGLECDHVFHNTLDNRKSQLRNVTRSENQRNKKMNSLKMVENAKR